MLTSNIIVLSVLIPILVGIFSYIVKIYIDNYFFQRNLFCGLMLYDIFLAFIKSDNVKKDWNADIAFKTSFIVRKINLSRLEYINTISIKSLAINDNVVLKNIKLMYFIDKTNKNIIFFINDYETNLKLFESIYDKKQKWYFNNRLFNKKQTEFKTLYKNYMTLLYRRKKNIFIPGINLFKKRK